MGDDRVVVKRGGAVDVVGHPMRREALYNGGLVITPVLESVTALAAWGRECVEGAFGGLEPRDAQHHLPVEDYVEILAELKPRFIHHTTTRDLVRAVVTEAGGDDQTYFDVPRLRAVTSDGYLTSGVGHALDPHRDTWWSAPR